MLVISEFVGCSPSLSGAIRVNPWNVDSVADGIYSAIKMPLADRHLRHVKHWRYVSAHTAAFWVKASSACTYSSCVPCYGVLSVQQVFELPLGQEVPHYDVVWHPFLSEDSYCTGPTLPITPFASPDCVVFLVMAWSHRLLCPYHILSVHAMLQQRPALFEIVRAPAVHAELTDVQ